MLPQSASSHYRRVQRLKAIAVASTRRAWRRMRPEGRWSEQYREDVGPKLAAVAVAAQMAAARDADNYVAEVLNELAFGPETAPGVLDVRGFAGVAGDGRRVETLLEQAVVKAGQALGAAATLREDFQAATVEALAEAERWLEMATETLVADAARAAEDAAMAQRPWLDGWVRMINPPCCSRCAVLSGKFYLFNEGFPRHPRCDCYHVPAPSDTTRVRDLIDINSPDRYFESLTELEQDRIFTKAGAQAVRNGADVSQVVNARRGMTTVGETKTQRRIIDGEEFVVNLRRRSLAFPGGLATTTEGTTRRGLGSRRRTGRNAEARLMPETIFKIASDRDDVIRLLKLNGFIL